MSKLSQFFEKKKNRVLKSRDLITNSSYSGGNTKKNDSPYFDAGLESNSLKNDGDDNDWEFREDGFGVSRRENDNTVASNISKLKIDVIDASVLKKSSAEKKVIIWGSPDSVNDSSSNTQKSSLNDLLTTNTGNVKRPPTFRKSLATINFDCDPDLATSVSILANSKSSNIPHHSLNSYESSINHSNLTSNHAAVISKNEKKKQKDTDEKINANNTDVSCNNSKNINASRDDRKETQTNPIFDIRNFVCFDESDEQIGRKKTILVNPDAQIAKLKMRIERPVQVPSS